MMKQWQVAKRILPLLAVFSLSLIRMRAGRLVGNETSGSCSARPI